MQGAALRLNEGLGGKPGAGTGGWVRRLAGVSQDPFHRASQAPLRDGVWQDPPRSPKAFLWKFGQTDLHVCLRKHTISIYFCLEGLGFRIQSSGFRA